MGAAGATGRWDGTVVMALLGPNALSPTAESLLALAQQAGDVLGHIDPDGRVSAWSDTTLPLGVPIESLFAADDGAVVAALLGSAPSGPVWLRRADAGDASAWVSVVTTPVTDSGWLVRLRPPQGLDAPPAPSVAPAPVEEPPTVPPREQALSEVAWLLSATPRRGKEIAVASCDLDDFSFVNEEYGREAGDEVLRMVMGRITGALRSGDLVARLEDDQILVVLRGVHHLRGAIRVANKIRAAVDEPLRMPFGDLIQTVSVGVTLISSGESVDEVLERAESAMAAAQSAGGNVVASNPPI